jgi:hypothetical protein
LTTKSFAPGLNGLDHERLLAHRAAHEHLGLRVELRDLPHSVDAAHIGHHDIHRDEVGSQLLILLDRLNAGFRFANESRIQPAAGCRPPSCA